MNVHVTGMVCLHASPSFDTACAKQQRPADGFEEVGDG